MILQNKISEDSSFSYHWRCEALNITHIYFVDDLLLFCGNSPRAATILKNSLDEFFLLSGMMANSSKSFILSAGMNPDFTTSIRDIFGYSVGSLPINYLDAPLNSSKITDHDCKCLIEKMMTRIKSWTNRSLSFAGRLQLIQSVLMSMQNFWAGLFILPKKSIKKMEQLIRSFLWKGIELKHTGPKVTWADITCPKVEGGLASGRLKT